MAQMSPREFIQRNYVTLSDSIAPHVSDVASRLLQSNVITRHMMEDIVERNNTNREKARKLLDLMGTRGSNALNSLYVAVVAEQAFEAADILKPENGPHTYVPAQVQDVPRVDDDSSDDWLPDSWPSEKDIKQTTVRNVDSTQTKMMKAFLDIHTPKGQEFIYLMSAKPRGRVLVINNNHFTILPERTGTMADRKAIEPLFRHFGFDVEFKNDKTAEKMWKILQDEAKKEQHKNAQCFVLVILSHGHNGVVFGIDGAIKKGHPQNYIEIKSITDLFCACSALQGKPKLFFIQACQGDAKNEGHLVSQSAESHAVPPKPATGAVQETKRNSALREPADIQNQETIIADTTAILDNLISSTASDAGGDKRPYGADLFVALATIPGFISYRNVNQGTWFIQAIAYVFARFAYKYDLNKLMTMVNRLVGRAEAGTPRYKQVCEKRDTFHKEFYFFPGLYDKDF